MNTSIIQNITFPLHQALFKRNTRKYLLELNETQCYSKKQIKEYQLNKLKKLAEHSFKYSKYYNSIFLENDVNPEKIKDYNYFNRIPLLSKKEATDNYNDIICMNLARRNLIWGATSGSTGETFKYAQDRNGCDFRDAIEIRSRKWWGIEYGEPVIEIMGRSTSFDPRFGKKIEYNFGRLKARFYNRFKFSAYDLSPSNMNKWIKDLSRIKPKSIYSYPSFAYFFSKYILNNHVDLSGLGLRAIICTGEPLFEEQRTVISKAFKSQVVNEYGLAEAGICAFECSHNELHIMFENIYLEILKGGKPSNYGEVGEIVITQLNNFAAPLIRYRTGDLGRYLEKKCSCGRSFPILENIEGRKHDVIIAPDGRLVYGGYFAHLLIYTDGVEKFQIVQERLDGMRLIIVRSNNAKKVNTNRLEYEIKKHFGRNMQIYIEFVNDIIPNKSGKFSWVISKLKKNNSQEIFEI